jgi:hypothetical protein
VYDVMGRVIRSLWDGELPAGGTDLEWNGQHVQGGAVGSGIYFACLEAGGSRAAVRVPFVR